MWGMSAPMNRRTLLRGSSILAAACVPASTLAFAAGASPQPGSSPIKLGIASYTFRKFDRAHLIDFLKELKTPYLNAKDTHLPMTPPDQVKQIADEYRSAGIILTALGTIYFPKDEDEDIRQKFEYCKAAGVSLIVGAPTHESLPRVEKFVKEYNIRVAIHNHGPEDKQWPSPLDVFAAVKKRDSRLGCCIDVGHSERAGTNVPDAIRTIGSRVFDIHMKDLTDFKLKGSQVAVGDGTMPVPAIFKALADIHYPGYVDLEYEINENDPMPGVVKSFAYMRGVIAGMGYTA